jgi:2-polyprenyl-3-methyl-5-hydroxy-6-metoxy-1,4-benzoquinol methylase
MWPDIVCPTDKLPLIVTEHAATCPRSHSWKRDVGITRMVSAASNYSDAFGLQWNTYLRTQLDSYTKTTLSRDRARRCLGEHCWEMLHRSEEMHVLEVGCGAGRFTEILLSAGAFVTSLDLSAAVEANQQNFPQTERHRVLQADVSCLPFAVGQYDIVFCLGVIQHTPRPEETLEKLYAQVKPDGWLVIDHYTYNLSEFTKTAFLFRMLLRRVRPEAGLKWTERLVDLLLPLHRAVRSHKLLQALLSRLSPVLSYYHALPLSDDLQREWALLDTHDALTDWHKHFRTRGQIRRDLERLGAVDICCEYGGNGVEARCRRPARHPYR